MQTICGAHLSRRLNLQYHLRCLLSLLFGSHLSAITYRLRILLLKSWLVSASSKDGKRLAVYYQSINLPPFSFIPAFVRDTERILQKQTNHGPTTSPHLNDLPTRPPTVYTIQSTIFDRSPIVFIFSSYINSLLPGQYEGVSNVSRNANRSQPWAKLNNRWMAHLGFGSDHCRTETSWSMCLVEYSRMGRLYNTGGHRRSHWEMVWRKHCLLISMLGIRRCTGRHRHRSSRQSFRATCCHPYSQWGLSNNHVDDNQQNASDGWDHACSTVCLSSSSPNATGWTHETAAYSSNLHAHGILRRHPNRLIFPRVLPVLADWGSLG